MIDCDWEGSLLGGKSQTGLSEGEPDLVLPSGRAAQTERTAKAKALRPKELE